TYLLDVQYRMCERLIGFSNETFYNNKIKSFIKDSHFVIQDTPCVFVDTKAAGFFENVVKKSKSNVGEAELVEKIITYIKSDDIGVISPYSSQVLLLKERLLSIEVASIDGFQGREKEFIIISLVRSNDKGYFGFLDNFKRLNVAVTRCKKGLIVVGNSDTFKDCVVISQFIKYVKKNFISLESYEIEKYFLNK
ncbi:DNA polymerase alpha-associated DNA helicase A, partial [Nosema granulosis]